MRILYLCILLNPTRFVISIVVGFVFLLAPVEFVVSSSSTTT